MAEELLRSTNAKGDLALPEVAQLFEELAAARGQSQKAALLRNAFQSASAGDVKYIVKIITGDLRIGSKESLVEEAIAKAFDRRSRKCDAQICLPAISGKPYFCYQVNLRNSQGCTAAR